MVSPAPTAGAITDAVVAHLTLTDPREREQLAGPVGAVLALIERWHGLRVASEDDPADDVPAAGAWPDDIHHGAVMLAARIYRRRQTPDALLAGDADYGAAYVARSDPDIAMLLHLDRWADTWII